MQYIKTQKTAIMNDFNTQTTNNQEITEAQVDGVLRTNLHDARYMESICVEGSDEQWFYTEAANSIFNLLLNGTFEEKIKISHP